MSFSVQGLLIATVLFCSKTHAQGSVNQGIRLADSPLGAHAGRVEVLYNGRWGTICDVGWSSYDAAVVCGMLNFDGYVCAVTSGTGTFGEGSGPVWLYNLGCGYYDTSLDDCYNNNLQTGEVCLHSRDAAVICQDNSIMPIPYNIMKTGGSTRTLDISWEISYIPPSLRAIDYKVYYRHPLSSYSSYSTYRPGLYNDTLQFNYTLTNLEKNTTYEIYIRAEGEYDWCWYNELTGNISHPVNMTTDAVSRPSTVPLRLVPEDLSTPYIGRLEVFHSGQWGSVCDDGFYSDEADVACYGLNYTRGAICYATTGFSYGSGPFWLTYVDCSRTDVFDECTHDGWGNAPFCSRYEEIGLICDPGPDILRGPSITGLKATKVAMDTITLEWNSVSFRGNYRILYRRSSYPYNLTRYIYNYGFNQYELTGLQLGNYTIQIRTEETLSSYGGNCYYSAIPYGAYSDPIYVETKETAPDVSTTNFHVSIWNSTTVEVTWTIPSLGLNGIVRGVKIFYEDVNGDETIFDIRDNTTEAYIIGWLQPSSQYSFSMLIYTVAEGPRGIHLTTKMPDSNFIPIISQFGVYGDGLERVTKYTYHRGFNVLCSSRTPNVTIYWQFTNGSRIGISNRGFRAGHFENGTAVLEVGTAFDYIRYIDECDGGDYTCVAISSNGSEHKKNFSLQVGYSPPAPNPPYLISKGSTWLQIGWEPLNCDGGHNVNTYIVQYKTDSQDSYYDYYDYYDYFFRPPFPPYYYYPSYTTAGRVTGTNSYIIRHLLPDSEYDVRIESISSVTAGDTYSSSITVSTPPQGPSPPHNIIAQVGSSPEVCLSWSRPLSQDTFNLAVFIVYAESIATPQDILDSIDLPNTTAHKAFPGSYTSGCVRVNQTEKMYQFQMSTVAYIGGEAVEGALSEITSRTVVYVPTPGPPKPKSFSVISTSNTSLTLNWSLSGYSQGAVKHFRVSYSGQVEWVSRGGVYVSFLESGEINSTNTTLTISNLTPSTLYQFQVSAVSSAGESDKLTTKATTSAPVGDKLAYFQLQIMDVIDCQKWQDEETEEKLENLRQSIATNVNTLCQCNFSPLYIRQGEFSCRGAVSSSDSIIYRARISGTADRSASDMAALVQSWVLSDTASVLIGNSRLQIDPRCKASLDNIRGPDCTTEPPTNEPSSTTEPSTTESPTTESPSSPVTELPSADSSSQNDDSPSLEDVLGLFIGGAAIGLLLTLSVLVFIGVLWWCKKRTNYKDQNVFNELRNEPSVGRNSMVVELSEEKSDKM